MVPESLSVLGLKREARRNEVETAYKADRRFREPANHSTAHSPREAQESFKIETLSGPDYRFAESLVTDFLMRPIDEGLLGS